jgi:calcineurin-like phosphoesterase family protein
MQEIKLNKSSNNDKFGCVENYKYIIGKFVLIKNNRDKYTFIAKVKDVNQYEIIKVIDYGILIKHYNEESLASIQRFLYSDRVKVLNESDDEYLDLMATML